MSSLRGCGKCGGIFSENEEDWSTFTGKQSRRDKITGRRYTEDVEDDSCPQCSRGEKPLANRPRLPLIGPYGNQETPAIENGSHEHGKYDARIADLETSELLSRVQALEAQVNAQVEP